MCRPIHHEVSFAATPNEIYRAFLSSREHSAFTGSRARTSARVGAAFTCDGGTIEGRNVELVPGERIVQAWRFQHWKKGDYSLITLRLTKRGKGTRLVLDHVGIPTYSDDGIDEGWTTYYWEPMRDYFARGR